MHKGIAYKSEKADEQTTYMNTRANKGLAISVGFITRMLLFFFVVIALFLVIVQLTSPKVKPVSTADELQGFDYSTQIAYINAVCFDWYPGALYTPEDFKNGNASQASQVKNEKTHGFYTYRLVLDLEEATVYGLSAYSATYAQRIWVDGELVSSVGTPGASLEATVPKTNYFTIYFEAKSGPTEIIIQRSDFVHVAGGQLYPQYFGEQSQITSLNDGIKLRGSIIVGTTLTAALFFFGIYLFFHERRNILWFSLACLLVSMRTLFTDHKLIMTLFPNMDWFLSHKVEYSAMIGFVFFFFLYLNRMFEKKVPRTVNAFIYLLCALTLLITLLTPSTFYTHITGYLQYVVVFFAIIAVLFVGKSMVFNRESRYPEHLSILFGAVALIAFAALDLVRYSYHGLYEDLNFIQVGMMAFVFANTLALALSFTRTERELGEVRQHEQEFTERNRMLDSLNLKKSEFLANMSHEIKTPLTVISGLAQLTKKEIAGGLINEETGENLALISKEAQRLADLADQVLQSSLDQRIGIDLEPVDPNVILVRATALCTPILIKNNNRIETITESCPTVIANIDMIVQVLANLCVNANHHCQSDVIVLGLQEEEPGFLTFCVEDHGSGIPAELLPHVFERGVSGQGRSGLGLPICRNIILNHGGEIQIQSEGGHTKVSFTLPLA